jgi:Tfp pilus assembly protein PilO
MLGVLSITLTFMLFIITFMTLVMAYYGDIVKKQFDLQAEIGRVREEKEQLRAEQTRAVEDLREQVAQLSKQLASSKGGKAAGGPRQ